MAIFSSLFILPPFPLFVVMPPTTTFILDIEVSLKVKPHLYRLALAKFSISSRTRLYSAIVFVPIKYLVLLGVKPLNISRGLSYNKIIIIAIVTYVKQGYSKSYPQRN